MFMGYKISIIVPVYNIGDYLRNTLDSIISQSIGFENLEVILVGDNSSKGCAEIIRKYAKGYNNVKGIYLDTCSGFLGKPMNVGLKHATADYVMYLNSGDLLEENGCKVLYDEMVKQDADIVCGAFAKIDDEKGNLNRINWMTTLNSPDEYYRLQDEGMMVDDPDFKLVVTDLDKMPSILGNATVLAKIFRKDFIVNNELVFSEDILDEDSVFLLESFFNAGRIVFIKDLIVNYNNIIDSDDYSSPNATNKNLYSRIKAYDLMYHISKRFSKERLFYKYLLGGKLVYWVTHHLIPSGISTFEINNIFNEYHYLFSNSYRLIEIPSGIRDIFREINNDNFDIAAEHVSKLQLESCPKSDNPIKVSVIIPVYNNEKFLRRCLDSVANQTLEEIEIICIDDGSSDGSLEILNSYKLDDERFKIISQKNSGAAIARNNGLNVVKGDFVAFVDSDDWLEVDALEKLYGNAISNGSDLVLFDSVEHLSDNKLKERRYLVNNNIKDPDKFTFNYRYMENLVMNGYLVVWSKFHKTSFLRDNNITFTNHLIFNDIQFHIKSMLLAKKISYCPFVLYNYLRDNTDSIQNKEGASEKSFVLLDIMDEIEEYLVANGFYEELESIFIKFKLTELQGRLNKMGICNSDEFYQLLKLNFQNMRLSNEQIQKLSFKNYRFLADVLTYDDYSEYCRYQENEIGCIDVENVSRKLPIKKTAESNTEIQKDKFHDMTFNNREDFELLKMYISSLESLIDNLQKVNERLKADLDKTRKAHYHDEKIIESLTKINNEFGCLQENYDDLCNCKIEQQKIIDGLLDEKEDLNLTIGKLTDENNKLKAIERELKASNSWKVTEPLRKINRFK